MTIELTQEDKKRGYVRSVRHTYLHKPCGGFTTMADPIAEGFARDPQHSPTAWCQICKDHRPIGQFSWLDGQTVGS